MKVEVTCTSLNYKQVTKRILYIFVIVSTGSSFFIEGESPTQFIVGETYQMELGESE